MKTDAYKSGWDAIFGKETTGGHFALDISFLYINVLELKGALLGLEILCSHLRQTHTKVLCQNATAACAINNMGIRQDPKAELINAFCVNCPKLAKSVLFYCPARPFIDRGIYHCNWCREFASTKATDFKQPVLTNLELTVCLTSWKLVGKQFNLSSGLLDLIIKSWSEGTAKQYESHLRRWLTCSENGIDPLNADVISGAEYFTQYFRKFSCENYSLNQSCSALSSILSAVNGFTFGEQFLIKKLLRRMFKKSPTCQSYTVIYGIKYIPDYVKKSSISNETLELALKILETMMCHLSGQRPQTLASLSTDYVYLNNSGCVFHISKLLKTSCPNSHQQPVEFNAYSYDFSLCVAALIKSHLDKTAASRHDMNSMLLLAMLSHKKTLLSKTFARWVSDVLH